MHILTAALELNPDDAKALHETYYQTYGLAIEGLVRHHQIDPLEYNRKVDDALPLEEVLHPDAELRDLITELDRSKVRLWLFTNAYVTHARRVVKLLGVDDLFDGAYSRLVSIRYIRHQLPQNRPTLTCASVGITYCDYAEEQLVCKPKKEMFEKGSQASSCKS